LLSDGHFRSVAGALKSIWVSDMLGESPLLQCRIEAPRSP
jgi:hypothetical protein